MRIDRQGRIRLTMKEVAPKQEHVDSVVADVAAEENA
ncbi:hypothetical protein AAUPMB_11725 [Pasteurella multocida subsp. multocida str. Anand1_buffalo]|nr:hypothetical protein AAUPMB_11725 [Pasteurella multocida subsp. multocida str. Anand1_buffalo]